MNFLRIKEVMKEKGIGVSELAKLLNVNRQTIYYYIQQDDKNPLYQVQKIANALNVELGELLRLQSHDDTFGFVKINDNVHEITSLEQLKRIVAEL